MSVTVVQDAERGWRWEAYSADGERVDVGPYTPNPATAVKQAQTIREDETGGSSDGK